MTWSGRVPEGPEVETIRRGLERAVLGQGVAAVQVLAERSFLAPPELIERRVVGAQVVKVARRAKVLMMELNSGFTLLFHLKMTGQIVLVRADGERYAGGHPSESMAAMLPDRSTRVVFELESGDRVYFNDQRRFGWIKLVPTAEVGEDELVGRLGPEVAAPEFSAAYLAAALARHRRAPVKAVILDQGVVAGVGNIYADESLHLARIHPARLAGSLSDGEVRRLHGAIRQIIALGMEHGGTSFAHYVNSFGGKGDYQDHARAYRMTGQPCVKCGTAIEKIRVAGRGTHYCPMCQSLPKT